VDELFKKNAKAGTQKKERKVWKGNRSLEAGTIRPIGTGSELVPRSGHEKIMGGKWGEFSIQSLRWCNGHDNHDGTQPLEGRKKGMSGL